MTKLQKVQAELEAKLARVTSEAKENLAVAAVEGKLALLDNSEYVNLTVKRATRENNIVRLKGSIATLNAIPTVQLSGGAGKVSVNCYPVGERYFGTEIAMVLGTLQASSMAFVDEHKESIQIALGVEQSLIEDATTAFGQPAYFSKRTFEKYNEIPGNYKQAKLLLSEVADKMKLEPLDFSKFSRQAYDAYFAGEEAKANYKSEEHKISEEQDATSEFTLPKLND